MTDHRDTDRPNPNEPANVTADRPVDEGAPDTGHNTARRGGRPDAETIPDGSNSDGSTSSDGADTASGGGADDT